MVGIKIRTDHGLQGEGLVWDTNVKGENTITGPQKG